MTFSAPLTPYECSFSSLLVDELCLKHVPDWRTGSMCLTGARTRVAATLWFSWLIAAPSLRWWESMGCHLSNTLGVRQRRMHNPELKGALTIGTGEIIFNYPAKLRVGESCAEGASWSDIWKGESPAEEEFNTCTPPFAHLWDALISLNKKI